MKKNRKIISLLFLISSLQAAAQNHKIDSLRNVLRSYKEDTAKVNTLNALALEYNTIDPDSEINLSGKAFLLSEKIKFEIGKGNALMYIGQGYYSRSDLPTALENYFKAIAIFQRLTASVPLDAKDKNSYSLYSFLSRTYGNVANVYNTQADYKKSLDFSSKALDIDKQLGNKKGMARHLGNIGNTYKKQGDVPRALDYYLKALHMHEEAGNKSGMAIWLGNIGIIYLDQQDYAKALDYFLKAMNLDEELKNKKGIERHLNNIGIIYHKQANYKKTLEYYNKAFNIATEINDKNFIALQLGNIGVVHFDMGDYYNAEDYYLKALKMDKEIGNKNNISAMLINLGSLDLKTKKYDGAEKYLKEALAMTYQLNITDYIRQTERAYSSLDSSIGDFRAALQHYKKYIAARDSMDNEESTKKQTRLEMQYDFNKQQAADSIKNTELAKQEEIKHTQEIKQQKIYTFGGAAGFVLMLVIAAVSFRAYRQKQNANTIISSQKDLVEMKQKEIIDSINYASRIQKSLLPSEKYIDKNFRRLKS